MRDRGIGSGASAFNVWDSRATSQRQALSEYSESITKVYESWTAQPKADHDFSARIEALRIGEGGVGRIFLSPITISRTKSDIARGASDCYFLTYLTAGRVKCDRFGSEQFAGPGDLMLIDGAAPVKLTTWDNPDYEIVTFMIPKSSFMDVPDADEHFRNLTVASDRILAPLASCFHLFAKSGGGLTEDGVRRLYHACVSLLPVSVAGMDVPSSGQISIATAGRVRRELLAFVERSIFCPDLTPSSVAADIGISVRYVHKCFAELGTTFGGFVMDKRLDAVRAAFISEGPRASIQAIAARCGFREMSTFYRAFRRRFGCAPSVGLKRGIEHFK